MSGHIVFNHKKLRITVFALIAIIFAIGTFWLPLRGDTDELADDPNQPAAEKEAVDSDLVTIKADYSLEWEENDEQVSLLRGHCVVSQGQITARASRMVVWRKLTPGRDSKIQITVYMEDDVRIDRPGRSQQDSTKLIHLLTHAGAAEEIRAQHKSDPLPDDRFYQRGQTQRKSAVRHQIQQTQLTVTPEPQPEELLPDVNSTFFQPESVAQRRIRIFGRNEIAPSFDTQISQNSTPPEQIITVKGGVHMIIDGVSIQGIQDLGAIDLSADRMVIWTVATAGDDLTPGGFESLVSPDTPLTVYMEGNIVIRQGTNVVRATSAVYDAVDHRALYVNVDLKTYIPQADATLRLRAARVRQLSRSTFHAQNAWTTTSPSGRPGYRLESGDIFVEDRFLEPQIGEQPDSFNPATGAPAVRTPWITSLDNRFYIEETPLLYTPRVSAPGKVPQVPLRRLSVGYDRVFGGQVKSAWNAFQLFGIDEDALPGVEWNLLGDIYTERGPGIGTETKYKGRDLFGLDDPFSGEGLLYYLNDQGQDNLGNQRRSIDPDSDHRYRAQLRHRSDLSSDLQVFGEFGLLSDRNFLEQYYEKEFDEGKDVESLVYAKQQADNWAGTVLVRPRLNDFTTTTEWLPRGDLYGLAEPLFGGWLLWSNHTSVGYGNLRPGETPDDPDLASIYTPLPYVDTVEGAVLMTRHQLDAPFNLGPIKINPYVMGEAAYWGEDFTRDELDRFVAGAGIQSSLFFSRIFPYVQSRVFDLNGLAHKVSLESEYAWTDSSTDLSKIPQYNEIDENSQERFRQLFPITTFGGALPMVFDPRFYAVRTGAGRSVTSPYHELVDDQQVARLAVRQRLQTKVGPPERLRIKDWMTLDLEAAFFPNDTRDNFGEEFGLLSANYRWNVGARTSFLADAYYDLFDNAQQLWSLGVVSQRSARGSIYLGMHQIKGASLDSQILSASYTYKMSEKWISTFGTGYDLAEGRNIGQSLTVTRVGQDFLVHVGANVDSGKDSVGFAIAIEPRLGSFFRSSTQLGTLLNPQQ